MWTLSTAYITKETDKWLTEQAKEPTEGLCVYEKEGGHFIHVPDDFDYEEMDLPRDIEIILAFAIGCAMDWICLDCDGPIEKMLKTYNWNENRVPIVGMLSVHNGNLDFWHDFNLSEKDEDKVWEILSKYKTSGVSVYGSKEDVIEEINNMYKE